MVACMTDSCLFSCRIGGYAFAHRTSTGDVTLTHSVIPAGLADEMIELRHRIHAHPELGFEEFATSDLVAERLQSWGYTVHRGLGGTGVVAQLTVGAGGRRLGIRADMDALPIHEATGLPYQSRIPGKMHACGHDRCCSRRRSISRASGASPAR
jgi:hypothetical protein